jgi:hypothetical protein
MKLHTQNLPQVRKLLRQGGWFSPSVLCCVLALEFFGRQSANDFYDVLGASALVVLVSMVAIRHRLTPLGWVQYVGRQAGKALKFADCLKLDFGPDLRGTPPIPRKLPKSVHLTVIVLLAWAAGAALLWFFLSSSWRSVAIQGSYTLYLVGMLVLWSLLFVGALAGVYFPFMLFNYLCPRAATGPDEPRVSRHQLFFLACYCFVIFSASWLLPLWVVPAFAGVFLVAMTLVTAWPRTTDIQFIWRGANSRRVYSATTPCLLWFTATTLTLFLLAISITAAGARLLGKSGVDTDMPLTVMLGVAVAWLTPGILISGAIFLFVLWKNNPSRPCRPSVHVAGDLAAPVWPEVKRILQNWGFRVSFEPTAAIETDVRIRLVETAQSQAREFDPEWPLAISIDDLQDGTVRDRLERRDEIQKRRLLLRGLHKIFRETKRQPQSGGSGWWLAPHLWFIPGLARDEMDDNNEDAGILTATVGPPFAQVMHRHVREYLYRMLRALQVDLIFVEDGIDFRKLKRVLRVLFEIYDKSAGKKRAEEVQFLGLLKMKILIHDFQLDEPFRSDNYPEPRFEDLGRARILHVFRDRGEQEELIETPFDVNSTPLPLFA